MLNYVPKWPLCVHLAAAVFCLTCSAIYHLYYVKSDYWRKVLLRLDIGGVNILVAGSAYPLILYGFACNQVFFARNCFLVLVTLCSITNFLLYFSERFVQPNVKGLRVCFFVLVGLAGASPFIYMTFTT